MTNYMTFLLCGHRVKYIEIKANTTKSDIPEINKYYVETICHEPFNGKSDLDLARLLNEQAFFEYEPARSEPLLDKAMVKMCEMGSEYF